MGEVLHQVPRHDEFLRRKGVKIAAVTDGDGKKMRHDIKNIGEFQATISLTKDPSGKINISVEAEPLHMAIKAFQDYRKASANDIDSRNHCGMMM